MTAMQKKKGHHATKKGIGSPDKEKEGSVLELNTWRIPGKDSETKEEAKDLKKSFLGVSLSFQVLACLKSSMAFFLLPNLPVFNFLLELSWLPVLRP